MREYENVVNIRDDQVDGIGPWYWIRSDTGAWIGPKEDWEGSHRQKWLAPVRDFTVCIQAGACQGMYPRLLSRHFRVVYAFEPDRLNFYVANLNCQYDSIHLFNAAVGKEAGFTGVARRFMDNVGMHQVEGVGSIPIMAIDSLKLPVCGLIALDIEGYEFNALQGAVETINRCQPVVICEAPSLDSIALLKELGYVNRTMSVADVVFTKPG
jgi:FkbM family methyltransferase